MIQMGLSYFVFFFNEVAWMMLMLGRIEKEMGLII